MLPSRSRSPSAPRPDGEGSRGRERHPKTSRLIFSWDEIGSYRLEACKVRTQYVDGEHLQLLRTEARPGGSYALHSHPHEQFSIMLSGRLRSASVD